MLFIGVYIIKFHVQIRHIIREVINYFRPRAITRRAISLELFAPLFAIISIVHRAPVSQRSHCASFLSSRTQLTTRS